MSSYFPKFNLRAIHRDLISWMLLLGVSSLIGFVVHSLPVGTWRTATSTTADVPKTIDLESFRQELNSKKIQVVDVRRRELFRVGHIPNSVSFPVQEMLPSNKNVSTLVKSHPVVVYCSGANCNDSKTAAKWLLEAGIQNVLILHEGFSGWVALGLPVEVGVQR